MRTWKRTRTQNTSMGTDRGTYVDKVDLFFVHVHIPVSIRFRLRARVPVCTHVHVHVHE
jgi:hypothetical protein